MFQLTKEEIEKIAAILKSGDRVEIVPTKDGYKVYRVRKNKV